MLVRLPLTAGRDMVVKDFAVAGEETGIRRSRSIGGGDGTLGRGFSQFKVL